MNELLERLKIDIGLVGTAYDARLLNLLNMSKTAVEKWTRKTVDISNVHDSELVIDYARWQWLTRREPSDMPRSLKYRLDCRLFEAGGSS
jgi:hypothetical protein